MLEWNICRAEIRMNLRSFIIWTAIMLAVVFVYLGAYAWLEDLALDELIEGYPDIFTVGLDMTPEAFMDVNRYWGTMLGFLGFLIGSIYAMMLAGGLISRDPDLGTVEFLYTRPVKRSRIMMSRVTVFFLMMTALWIIIYIASITVGLLWAAPEELDPVVQGWLHLAGYLAALAAGGIAFAAAPFFDRVQGTTSLAIGLGMAFLVFNMVSKLADPLLFLRYLSLHYYADMGGAAAGEPFTGGLFTLVGIFVAGTLAGVHLLNRKEFDA